jgi:hypothetical protein
MIPSVIGMLPSSPFELRLADPYRPLTAIEATTYDAQFRPSRFQQRCRLRWHRRQPVASTALCSAQRRFAVAQNVQMRDRLTKSPGIHRMSANTPQAPDLAQRPQGPEAVLSNQ